MIRIAFGQIQVQPGQPQINYQSMLQAIAYAKAVNTDILIFPELCISGYLVGDLWDQISFVKDCLYYGEELVKATKDSNLSIVFGNVAIDHQLQNQDGSLRKYNALYVASQGKLLHNESQPYPFTIKTLLPSYRYFNEPRYFTSATTVSEEKQIPLTVVNQPVTIPTRHGTFIIAPMICEDSWDTHYNHCPTATMMSASKEQGIPVNLIVNCSASPFSMQKQEQRHQLFSQQAAKYHTPIAYVNAVGIQNNGKNICLFDGCSTLYDAQGSIVEDTPAFEDTVRPVLLKDTLWSPAEDTKESTSVPLETASEGHHFSQSHYIPNLYKALHYGIRQFLKQTGIQRIVIGASGGIDSAVNAALYSTVIPPDHLYLVNMPSRYNSDMTKDLAYQLAKNIGCHYGVTPIEDGVTATIQQLESTPFDLLSDTTIHTPDEAPSTIVTNRSTLTLSTLGKENIQARDRSSRILAGIASAVNGAFTCNGNKTEFTIGYATMYGDLAGFLAATGDLWKQDVYALAQYMNEEIFKREVIPQGSIEVVPSAELSSAQDITQGMGDPLQYEYHDRLFRSFVEGIPVDRNDVSSNRTRLTPEEILHAYALGTLDVMLDLPKSIRHYFPNASSFIADLECWWKSYNGLAVAKRIQAPPILLVSERGFGNDLCESQIKVYFSRQYEELKHKLEAIKNDIMTKNYALDMTLPPAVKSNIHKPFTPEEISILWQHTDDILVRIVLIYIYTGMRPVELYQVKLENVNLKEQYVIGGSKTAAGKDRMIPLADCIMPFIKEIYSKSHFSRSETLLPPKLIPTRLSRPIEHLCESLGLSKHKPHDTRLTFITLARNAGMDIYILKSIVGHTHTGDVTSDVYIHKTRKQFLDAVNTLPVTFTGEMMSMSK